MSDVSHSSGSKRPLVYKFGGTSLGDVVAIERLIALVRKARTRHPVLLVVSALPGVTDRLDALSQAPTAERPCLLSELENQHRFLARSVLDASHQTPYLARLSAGIRELGTLTKPGRDGQTDRILAYGERWSAPLIAGALTTAGIPACATDGTDLIRVHDTEGRPEVAWASTRRRIRAWYEPSGPVPVITGYIAATRTGEVRTLGRGGSDYSATIIAAALRAVAVDRWTDVDGVYDADPRRAPGATRHPVLDMSDALRADRTGGLGMHPATLLPLLAEGIPLRVRSPRSPSRHTLILPPGLSPTATLDPLSN